MSGSWEEDQLNSAEGAESRARNKLPLRVNELLAAMILCLGKSQCRVVSRSDQTTCDLREIATAARKNGRLSSAINGRLCHCASPLNASCGSLSQMLEPSCLLACLPILGLDAKA